MPFENMRPNFERANETYVRNKRKGDSGEAVPEGTYLVVVTSCELTQSKDQSKDLLNFPCEVVRQIGARDEQAALAQQGRVVRGFTVVPDASAEDWHWNLIRGLAAAVGYDENADDASLRGLVEAARDKYALIGVAVKDGGFGPQAQVKWIRKAAPELLRDLPERSTEDDDVPF